MIRPDRPNPTRNDGYHASSAPTANEVGAGISLWGRRGQGAVALRMQLGWTLLLVPRPRGRRTNRKTTRWSLDQKAEKRVDEEDSAKSEGKTLGIYSVSSILNTICKSIYMFEHFKIYI
mmetsp:Transcript_19587/g.25322  ORF Transcript_19587/g.25322 Transcript_19587/m.25322 type:complete len:119 (+) Transcript_19587:1035-1391(+)